MKYAVQILPRAQKQSAKLLAEAYTRVRDALQALAENPHPAKCLKPKARSGWRLRIGKYRAIYEIDDAQRAVTILDVGHQREVYRDR